MNNAKSINLYMPDGSYENTIEATILGWNTTGYKLSRNDVFKFQKEINKQHIGIYFLLSKDDDDKESVYIGESMDIVSRLQQHIRDYNTGKEKFYWTEVIFFSCDTLNKTYIHWLENHFYKLAVTADRYTMLTKNTYVSSNLKNYEEASLMQFVDNMKLIIKAIGYKFLIPLSGEKVLDDNDLLYIKRKKYVAIGKTVENGFLVLKGSQINDLIAPSLNKNLKHKRKELIDDGIIVNGVFVKDYLFTSPSSAASIIIGSSSSGPLLWIDENGKKLRDKES